MTNWYLIKPIKFIYKDGHERNSIALEKYITENVRRIDENGIETVVPMSHRKYQFSSSIAYNEDNPPYTLALVRTDGVLEVGDYVKKLETKEDFDKMKQVYPKLAGRFIDQPFKDVI